jgi:hypothetical protein
MRFLIFVHRWLGVALCVLVFVWFLSGIGMMYFPFPTVTPEDRIARAPALDPTTVVLAPLEAVARAGIEVSGAEVRLNTFDGRPVYRFSQGRRGDVLVYADTGEPRGPVTKEMRDRIASAWAGLPAEAARVDAVEAVDQWTVQASLRVLRPLWKHSWPSGEQVYIAGASGEVVQFTTTASRIGAYLGPIPHWFYFTPLRVRQLAWSRFVIWTSGLATVAAIMGLAIGLWMYSPSKRYRYKGAPARIPYVGQKRWHAVLGLVFGVATVTWAFSGMLSMDPFPALAGGSPATREGPSVTQMLRGRVSVEDFAARSPRQALEALAPAAVKDLEFTSLAGEPMYLATLADGSTRLVPVHGAPVAAIDADRIAAAVTSIPGSGVETEVLSQYDRYYLDRARQRPLPVVLARMNDGAGTRYYIDPATARVVGSYSHRNRVSRWLYNGLHSLNFPWLYNHRPLWDVVVITFMLGGAALSITSLVLAWQVLGRTVGRAWGRPIA